MKGAVLADFSIQVFEGWRRSSARAEKSLRCRRSESCQLEERSASFPTVWLQLTFLCFVPLP